MLSLNLFRFQSTLPCGSDLYLSIFCCILLHFNPRSLAGATLYAIVTRALSGISIHAPLRERQCRTSGKSGTYIFQSTLPCGSDLGPDGHVPQDQLFQSTLPCGSDQRQWYDNRHACYFNPRSLAGATSSNIPPFTTSLISIHAPLRERPLLENVQTTNAPISIHAPLRERP